MGKIYWGLFTLVFLLQGVFRAGNTMAQAQTTDTDQVKTSAQLETATNSNTVTDESTSFDNATDPNAANMTDANIANRTDVNNANMTDVNNANMTDVNNPNITDVFSTTSPEPTSTDVLDLTTSKKDESSVTTASSGMTPLTPLATPSHTPSSVTPSHTPTSVTPSHTPTTEITPTKAAAPKSSSSVTSSTTTVSSITKHQTKILVSKTTPGKSGLGKQEKGPSSGVVAGTVIGVLLAVVVVVIGIFIVIKKTKSRREGYGMFSNIGGNTDDDGEWTFNNPSYGSNAKHTSSKGYSDVKSY